MKQAFLLLAWLIFLIHPAGAASRFTLAEGCPHISEAGVRQSPGQPDSVAISPYGADHAGPAHDLNVWSNRDGVISLAMGLAAATIAIALVINTFLWSPFIAVAGITAAVLAVVFGARGRRKSPKGFAVAGFVLGVVELGVAATLLLAIGVVLLILGI